MKKDFTSLISGYTKFQDKVHNHKEIIIEPENLKDQDPVAFIVTCCDARIEPSVLLQCNIGDLFTVRNVANIIPPYENDEKHHGTSAALEFGINFLKIPDLIILGHSNCGGIEAAIRADGFPSNDFISNWVSQLDVHQNPTPESVAKNSLLASKRNCLSYPWIKKQYNEHKINIHLWYYDVVASSLQAFNTSSGEFINFEQCYQL